MNSEFYPHSEPVSSLWIATDTTPRIIFGHDLLGASYCHALVLECANSATTYEENRFPLGTVAITYSPANNPHFLMFQCGQRRDNVRTEAIINVDARTGLIRTYIRREQGRQIQR
jgi:hypothetical protein